MENASKALIIAGGILFALLIIGMAVTMWITLGDFNSTQDEAKSQEQLAAFNKQFESYQRQIMRGADLASIINKINDNNNKNIDNPELKMSWKFNLRTTYISGLPAREYSNSSPGNYISIVNDNGEAFKDFKRLFFRCTKLEYSSRGRVSNMEFEEVLASEIFN